MDDMPSSSPDRASHLDTIIVRDERPEDRNFILSSWLRTYRRFSPFTRNISSPIFYEWHEKVIKRLFQRGAVAHVAALKDDDMVVLGYLVIEGVDQLAGINPIIHFALVKEAFHNAGVMRTLLYAARIDLKEPTEYTHHTYDIEPILGKYPKLRYNPYLL